MPIYINTNQNVNVEYEISSIGSRMLAYLIDSAVILGLTLVFIFLFNFLHLSSKDAYLWIFATIPLFLYHLICEVTMNGQSIGKKAMKIKVMKADGTAATFSNYFLRFLLRPIDSFYFIGLSFVFFTKKGQRLGDLAANTVVVKIQEDISFSSLTHSMNNTKTEVIFPEVNQLKDKDIEIIKNVLNNWKMQPGHDNVFLLAKKVQEMLNIETKEPPYKFLKQIVQSYHSLYA